MVLSANYQTVKVSIDDMTTYQKTNGHPSRKGQLVKALRSHAFEIGFSLPGKVLQNIGLAQIFNQFLILGSEKSNHGQCFDEHYLVDS